MFRNRIFNTTLLISLTCHLICMLGVTIVILPGRYRTRDLTSVSFLGPILEKTVLEIILANKPVAVTTTYQRDLKYRHSVGKEAKPLLRNNIKEHISTRIEDDIAKALARAPRRNKEIPAIVTKASGRNAYFKGSGAISGPVSDREVIYKPEEPELPGWVDASSSFKLEFEFFVSVQGEVKRVIPVVSSGNAEVDLMGMRYLKNWKFAPLAQNLDSEQKGRAKFIFERER